MQLTRHHAAAFPGSRRSWFRRVYPPRCAYRMSRSYVRSQPTSRADLYEFILVSVTTIRPATARIPGRSVLGQPLQSGPSEVRRTASSAALLILW